MIAPLRLQVVTPVETLLDVEPVQYIRLRLADGGGLSIYPGHAPLLAETVAGAVCYTDAAGTHEIELEAGILSITPQGVTILAPGALHAAGEASARPDAEREVRFERLAATLLETLRAESELSDG